MQFPRSLFFLLGLLAALSAVLADSNSTYTASSTNGLILTTVTSGSITQTLVLKTTTITSCPCSATGTSAPTAVSPGATLPVIQGSSGANHVRPAMAVAVAAVLGGAVFVLAWVEAFNFVGWHGIEMRGCIIRLHFSLLYFFRGGWKDGPWFCLDLSILFFWNFR